MSDQPPTSYRELAGILDNLPMILREACRGRHITQNVAAKQIGVSPSTVSRLITGVGDVSLEGAIAMLLWLDKPPTSEVES
jgi:plasmid maintenance system antidote protein VapI